MNSRLSNSGRVSSLRVGLVIAGLVIAGLTLLTGCSLWEDPEPSPTSTPMPSPSPTASPTPTPAPLSVRADSLLPPEAPPIPVANAACGVVDRLDMPVGPPSGDGYHVRWEYGRDSRRYGKIHAGEDWLAMDGPSLGRTVHSIAHGQVSYANGLGWGRDQGVVIIRHVFPDGTQRLSQYGHLEPDSVTLSPGDCVARGDPIGRIGDPKTRPHLHFEIRSHLPGEPGPGYWSTDPSEAGWEHPSWFIWQQRTAGAPGVIWTRAWESASTDFIGEIEIEERELGATEAGQLEAATTLVVLADGTVSGLDPGTGGSDWELPTPGELLGAEGSALAEANASGAVRDTGAAGDMGGGDVVTLGGAAGLGWARTGIGLSPEQHGGWCAATVDQGESGADGPHVYAVSCAGHVAAVALTAASSAEPISWAPELGWARSLPAGMAVNGLIPRPGGGVYAATGRTLIELARDGGEMGRHTVGVPTGWSVASDRILVSTRTEGTYLLQPNGQSVRVSELEGTPIVSSDWNLLVTDDGLYGRHLATDAATDPGDDTGARATVPSGTAANGSDDEHAENHDVMLSLLHPMEAGSLSLAEGTGLPDGGALVTHRTRRQSEVLRLRSDGEAEWARALPSGDGLWASPGLDWFAYGARVVPPELIVGPRGAYLLMASGHVLALDPDGADPTAQLILDPGNGPRMRGESEAFAAGIGALVIDARTGLLIGLDPSVVTGGSVRAPGGDAGG